MTRADKFEEIFGYRPAIDQVLCNEHDYCGESDACNYCMCNPNNIGRGEDWWNAEYQEPTTKDDLPSVTPQEPKIKVLERDEVARKLGTVDIYKASAWITLLKDLEYLGLKICEVEE